MTQPPKSPADKLISLAVSREARVGVVGLGYVGLPLASELARSGFLTVGVDRSAERVGDVSAGRCYIPDIEQALFERQVREGRLSASVSEEALSECDAAIICVPTPLRKTKDPDLSYVIEAAGAVARCLKPGALVIVESTTYPGATEELILPLLASGGKRAGEDFFLCFSPERVDPANKQYGTRQIPKVIGGITPACTAAGVALYEQVMDQVVPVSSTRVAEMVKLLENTFRMINVGLANEMALMCDRMKIDVWEVIEAAATKPFGFMPFYPGPGLGGHCIPVDPHYLSWKSRQTGYQPQFIELATEINGRMPRFVVDRVLAALNEARKPLNGSKIHVVGVSYKRDVSDVRESPALDIIALLRQFGASVSYSDPFVAELEMGPVPLQASDLLSSCADADCVVIVTDHTGLDYASIVSRSQLIVDARNALRGFKSAKIVRL